MHWLSAFDATIVLLVVIPFLAIAFGVISAKLSRQVFIGPLITLVSALKINFWYFSIALPGSGVPPVLFLTWAILFPFLSLPLSWYAVRRTSR